jgi:hypothetical protein
LLTLAKLNLRIKKIHPDMCKEGELFYAYSKSIS